MVCHGFWLDHLIKSYHTNNFQWSWLAYTMGLVSSYFETLNFDWFSQELILISFFKEIIKKNFFMASYLLFWNFFGDMIHEKFKKTEICSKNFIIFSSNLNHIFWPRKCWNLDFSISIKVVENWISLQKTSIPNQLEFWAASYGQNTKQV